MEVVATPADLLERHRHAPTRINAVQGQRLMPIDQGAPDPLEVALEVGPRGVSLVDARRLFTNGSALSIYTVHLTELYSNPF
jgi:hypothetical protein